jgi:hypothetical protein
MVTSILLAILMSQRWDHAFSAELTLAVAIEAGVSTMYGLLSWLDRMLSSIHPLMSFRFVGLGEDPDILAIRAPGLFGVRLYCPSLPCDHLIIDLIWA